MLAPLLDNLQSISSATKHVAFANNLTGTTKLHQIKSWWDYVLVKGPQYGYYAKPAKSYIIVKHQYDQNAKELFFETNIIVTVSEAKHLEAVIESVTLKLHQTESYFLAPTTRSFCTCWWVPTSSIIFSWHYYIKMYINFFFLGSISNLEHFW